MLALAKSKAQILVPVMREQRIPAWPRPNDERAPKVDYQPLGLALVTEHATDAHFTAYCVPTHPYRLNKSAPEAIQDGVLMLLAVFDVDGPEHAASDDWWGDQGENLARLNEKIPDLFVYRTRGGYRIVGKLGLPFVIRTAEDAKFWTEAYLTWCAWLWRCFQIKADPVGDWQRLYRLPIVKREGKTVRYETLGDPSNVGAWQCFPSVADIESAKTLRRKPTTDKPKGTAKTRPLTSNYTGSGILVRVLQNRGDLGSEIQPGMWAIRWPRANEHSSGSDFDTSTVVFAPNSSGDDLGWIDCKHTNCGHFDKSLKDWLRCFDQSELDRAREQLGIPVQKPQPKPDNDSFDYTDDDAPDAPPASGDSAHEPEAKATPKSRIQLIEPAQIFAPLEEPDYVVDRAIRRSSLTQLVGYGGGFKTWTALDAVLSVGSGRHWLGRFPVKQGRAVYLDYENGQYEMRRRAHALAKAAGLANVENIGFACMPPVYMSDAKFGPAVEPLAEGCSLLVVDTLKAANPGTDENDSNMRLGLDALRRVGEKTGCAFLVLVHSKKTSGSILTIDPREAGRGSSAIYDAADTVFHATYVEGKPLHIQQTKARLGRPVDPFLVTIADTANGGVSVSASDVPDTLTDTQEVFENVVCVSVLECLKACPGASLRLLAEKLGKRHGTVSAALEQLARNGAARNTGDSRSGRWFAT